MSQSVLQSMVERAMRSMGSKSLREILPFFDELEDTSPAGLTAMMLDSQSFVYNERSLNNIAVWFQTASASNSPPSSAEVEALGNLLNRSRVLSRHAVGVARTGTSGDGMPVFAVGAAGAEFYGTGREFHTLVDVVLSSGTSTGGEIQRVWGAFLMHSNGNETKFDLSTQFLRAFERLWAAILLHWFTSAHIMAFLPDSAERTTAAPYSPPKTESYEGNNRPSPAPVSKPKPVPRSPPKPRVFPVKRPLPVTRKRANSVSSAAYVGTAPKRPRLSHDVVLSIPSYANGRPEVLAEGSDIQESDSAALAPHTEEQHIHGEHQGLVEVADPLVAGLPSISIPLPTLEPVSSSYLSENSAVYQSTALRIANLKALSPLPDVPGLDINAAGDRQKFQSVYGGTKALRTKWKTVSGIGSQMATWPNPDHDPFIPKYPGDPGLLLTCPGFKDGHGNGIKTRGGDVVDTVIQKVASARWRYMGEYKFERVEPLSTEEWNMVPNKVKDSIVKNLYRNIGAKRTMEGLLGMPHDSLSDTGLQRALQTGSLKFELYTMECVGYHPEIQMALTSYREDGQFIG